MSPKFSIIIPHYDGVVSDERLIECMNSLASQTLKDYEILMYHDGPLSRDFPIDYPITITDRRVGDWGHSLRDRGIREAKGEYIVHLNADNILYPNALEEVNNLINKDYPFYSPTNKGLIVIPILMIGCAVNGNTLWRDLNNTTDSCILTGYPARLNFIDCMQLIMKRDIWLQEGGWFLKDSASDGRMYEFFVGKYGARYCNKVLGEHR
jgi:glycosyltransferase involved in cell wall biosynthesis